MNAHLERAHILIDQRRYVEAESELALALSLAPDEPLAHALLARCLMAREQFEAATEHAERAVALAPDWPVTHYFLATMWLARNDPQKAETSAREAIALAPADATCQLLLGRIHYMQSRWGEARTAAERALAVDPEHLEALNLQAEALRKLGARGPAEEQLRAALAVDADNPRTHANIGWLALEKGERPVAIEHFREALRIDPELDTARRGVVESLKAWNPFYRLFLKYVFLMQRLGSRTQWLVILAAWAFYAFGQEVAWAYPRYRPLVWPVGAVYLFFVLGTWLARPVSNLVLRLHPFGRLALSRDERIGSNWIGSCLVLVLAAGASFLIHPNDLARDLGLYFGLMVLPLAATFAVRGRQPRRYMAIYTALAGVVGMYCVVLDLTRELIVKNVPGTLGLALLEAYRFGVPIAIFAALLSLLAGNVLMSICWKQ